MPCVGKPLVHTAKVSVDNEDEDWFCIVMSPYLRVLTPSRATPKHFAQCAKIIVDVARERSLVCNDISLDNMLIDSNGDNVTICDWGLATPLNTIIGGRGKHLFIAPAYRLGSGEIDPGRKATVRGDLYSLFLVAVCCALNEVPWACAKSHKEIKNGMLKAIGSGFTRGPKFHGDWSYLPAIRVVLDSDKSDDEILELFQRGAGLS